MGVVLRAWYRIPLGQWDQVHMSGPFGVESRPDRFQLEAFIDDSGPGEDSEPTLVVRAYMRVDVSPDVLGILRGDDQIETSQASDDGYGSFPESYTAFVQANATRMAQLSTRVLELAEWLCSIRGGTAPLPPRDSFHWAELTSDAVAFQDLAWRQIPRGLIWLHAPVRDHLVLGPDLAAKINRLIASEVEAPLGHSLLREAWRTQDSDPRSALVMAVAAAESGVKQLVARIVPEATWLVEEAPSPPIEQMLKQYLPQLPSLADGVDAIPPVPPEWMKVLRNAVAYRNRVVHGRVVSVARSELSTILDTVFELLDFLDRHAGYDAPDSA